MLLLRHGQSEWNAQRRWQGTADPPLTGLGRQQAQTTGEVLDRLGVTFAGVWSSDLRRAQATAQILARRLELRRVVIEPDLREAHAGEWEGMTPDEIERAWPGYLAGHHRPPRFEPFHDVVTRVTRALRGVAGSVSEPSAVALVVTHSGVIRSIVRELGRVDGRIPNMGGVWLNVTRSPATELGDGDDRGIVLGDEFDPAGVVVSGIDAPGEDPSDEPDDADAHGTQQG